MSQREKVSLIDENDVVIGKKWRDELLDTDRCRMVTIWVENSSGEILIQKRAQDKRIEPGKWSPAAAGTVSAGDEYEETAHRELSEELGINDTQVLFEESKTSFKAEIGFRINQNYRCIINLPIDKFSIQKEEVIDLKWIKREELLRDLLENPDKYVQKGNWKEIYDF